MKKLYSLLGYVESWGAKHLKKQFFAPEILSEELIKAGAKIECSCHYPCINKLGGQGRYSVTLVSIESDEDRVEIPVPPYETGSEGYDVALADPWDADPRKHYQEDYSTTNVVEFTSDIPEFCRACNRDFYCTCYD